MWRSASSSVLSVWRVGEVRMDAADEMGSKEARGLWAGMTARERGAARHETGRLFPEN